MDSLNSKEHCSSPDESSKSSSVEGDKTLRASQSLTKFLLQDFPWLSEAKQIFQKTIPRRFSDDSVDHTKEPQFKKSVTFSDQENDSEEAELGLTLKVPVTRGNSTPTQFSPKGGTQSLAPVVKRSPPPRPPRPKGLAEFTPKGEITSGSNERSCSICHQQLQQFKERFTSVHSHKEKYEILTSVPVALVPDDNLKKEFPCTDLIACGAAALRASQGAFSSPLPQFVQHIPEFVKRGITAFFNDSKNGGELTGKEQMGETGKIKWQKRAMFVSLSQLYQEFTSFQAQYKSVTISRFAYLAPNNLVWSKRFRGGGHAICLLHENFTLLLSACHSHYSAGILQVMSKIICPEKESLCMFGYCDKCPKEKNLHSLVGDYELDEVVEFYFWEANDNNTGMTLMSEPLPQFTTRLDSTIRKFLKHFFISTLQNDYLKQVHSDLSQERWVVLIKMDFCEPYTVVNKIGSKKASKYFNYDPHNTISVYPFIIKYYDLADDRIQVRNIVVISNDLRDNATSAYLFQSEMMKWLKLLLPQIKNVIYFADDNTKHYKNSEVILNLLFHEEDYNIKASLEFTVEGHDMEDAGTLATEIKRKCRLASLNGSAVINCAEDMLKFCRREMSRQDLQFCIVDRFNSRIRSMELRLQRRYKLNNGIIPGIEHFYSFQPDYTNDVFKSDTIRVRRYSLSSAYAVVKVTLSSNISSRCDDFPSHYLCSYIHPYDESKLIQGNIVTVSLEGRVFTGKINQDEQVRLGNLGVGLISKIEEGKDGKIFQIQLAKEIQAWVSTVDVLMVEEGERTRGDQTKKKKKEQEEDPKWEDRRRRWSARAVSSRRLFSSIRKKDK